MAQCSKILLLFATAMATLLLGGELRAAPRAGLPIGYSTTRITGPLTKDGQVDYVAAFNQRYGKGVTPQNNAAVPLLILFRPGSLQGGSYKIVKGKMVYVPDPSYGQSVRRALGITLADITGPEFIRYHKYRNHAVRLTVDRGARLRKQVGNAPAYVPRGMCLHPWSAKANPWVATWLGIDAGALATAVRATQCRHFFVPLIAGNNASDGMAGGVSAVLRVLAYSKAISDAMAAQAMLELQKGHLRRCAVNLLAIHRLARLSSREDLLISSLVADSIDAMACRGDDALAESGKLSSKSLRAYLQDLSNLPRFTPSFAAINAGERWIMLDDLQHAAASGNAAAFVGFGSPVPQHAASWNKAQFARAMRCVNQYQDQLVKIFKIRNYRKRDLAFHKMEVGSKSVSGSENIVLRQMSKTFGRTIPVQAGRTACSRLSRLILALAAYRSDHGAFPNRLAKLAPKYLPDIPHDPFTGKAFTYAAGPTGCTLSSPGEFAPGLIPGAQIPHGRPIVVHLSLPP
jgi:hypothetical protein